MTWSLHCLGSPHFVATVASGRFVASAVWVASEPASSEARHYLLKYCFQPRNLNSCSESRSDWVVDWFSQQGANVLILFCCLGASRIFPWPTASFYPSSWWLSLCCYSSVFLGCFSTVEVAEARWSPAMAGPSRTRGLIMVSSCNSFAILLRLSVYGKAVDCLDQWLFHRAWEAHPGHRICGRVVGYSCYTPWLLVTPTVNSSYSRGTRQESRPSCSFPVRLSKEHGTLLSRKLLLLDYLYGRLHFSTSSPWSAGFSRRLS